MKAAIFISLVLAEKKKLFHFTRKEGGDERGKNILFFFGKAVEKATFRSNCKQKYNIKLTLGKSLSN
jgi:hypothetical protein